MELANYKKSSHFDNNKLSIFGTALNFWQVHNLTNKQTACQKKTFISNALQSTAKRLNYIQNKKKQKFFNL